MTAVFLSLVTFLSTTLGGIFALRHRPWMHLIMGFTAGVLVGLVAFDLLPEIFRQINAQHLDPTGPMGALVVGFLLFHTAEKIIVIYHARDAVASGQPYPTVGVLSAAALCGHSFLDGVGIGVGFQVSTSAGVAVAIAVIAHDFSDGLNTVTLMLVNNNPLRRTLALLLTDAMTPVLGALSTLLFRLPHRALPFYLGFFAGFLLYIGASDILPRAWQGRGRYRTIVMTVLGTIFAFAVTRFA